MSINAPLIISSSLKINKQKMGSIEENLKSVLNRIDIASKRRANTDVERLLLYFFVSSENNYLISVFFQDCYFSSRI